MAYEFKLPDLGEGLTEGEIARWLVQEGQEIAEDDPLVEVQTDKTTVEIPSPAAGKVASILVEEGKVVPVGTVLVVIGEERCRRQRSSRAPSRRRAPQAADPDRAITTPCDPADPEDRAGARRRPRRRGRHRAAGPDHRGGRAPRRRRPGRRGGVSRSAASGA